MSKANEWELLRRQFDALTPDESVESIEDILDAQFRRRFCELSERQIANTIILIGVLIFATPTHGHCSLHIDRLRKRYFRRSSELLPRAPNDLRTSCRTC